jgi:hypothetical protein
VCQLFVLFISTKVIYTNESSLTTGRSGKTQKVQRPAGTEIAFEDRYLAPNLSSGQIFNLRISCYYPNCYSKTYSKRARDKLGMNTTQYVIKILEPHLAPFIYSLPGNPGDYQTIEDRSRVHTVKLCNTHGLAAQFF